jgi:hypothetical protein
VPTRKYVLRSQSMQSFIQPLPTDRLLWLIKIAADEIADRELASKKAVTVHEGSGVASASAAWADAAVAAFHSLDSSLASGGWTVPSSPHIVAKAPRRSRGSSLTMPNLPSIVLRCTISRTYG